jgi:hypothetical protein
MRGHQMIIDEDEAYAEWVADVILSYFTSQLQSGRTIIYESEIWQMLGSELPEGQENRQFKLKEYVNNPILEDGNENIIDFAKYKKKLN